MSVVRTKQNMVLAYEPEEDDLFVQVVWHGPGEDGRHLRPFEGPPWPIGEYERAVAWAVGIADEMRFPLHVVPLSAREGLTTEHVRRGIADLTDQQRGELRRLVVGTLAQVMRDSDDAAVRADAYDALLDLGVGR